MIETQHTRGEKDMNGRQKRIQLKKSFCWRFLVVKAEDKSPSGKNGRKNWRRAAMVLNKNHG